MFEFLNKLNFSKGVRISIMIFGNIIAPYWFLYQFFRPLVTGNNFIQQLIICLAIAIPVSIIGYILELWAVSKKDGADLIHIAKANIDENLLKDNKQDLTREITNKLVFKCLSLGSINTAIIFYLPCMLTYFLPLDKNEAIRMCMYSYGGVIISIVMSANKVKKKKTN